MPIEFVDVYQDSLASWFLWDVLRDRMDDPDVNISATMPTWEEHVKFFNSKPYPLWFLISNGREYVGYISLTNRNEIGIVILKEHHNKGYGSSAVKKLMDEYDLFPPIPSERVGKFIANINPLNTKSIEMFERLGFKHIQNTYKYG